MFCFTVREIMLVVFRKSQSQTLRVRLIEQGSDVNNIYEQNIVESLLNKELRFVKKVKHNITTVEYSCLPHQSESKFYTKCENRYLPPGGSWY